MNSKHNWVVIVSLAMLLSACSSGSTSTSTGGKLTDDRGSLLMDVATADQLSARIQWQQNLNLPLSQAIHSLTPMGDRLAIVERGNVLAVLHAASGNLAWQQIVGDRNEKLGTPVRRGKQLFIASETILYVFNIETGTIDQQFNLAHLANTTPIVDESQVIFGSPTGRVFSQLIRSGITRWEYNMGTAIVTTPLSVTGMIVVVDHSGSLAMLNATNGNIVWRNLKPPYAPVVAQPVTANAITYVASTDQYLYAFDRISGSVIWRYLSEKPMTADPVAIGDRVYQRTADQGLLCLDGLSGEVFWKSDAPGRPILLRGRNLWLRDKESLSFLDPATGITLKSVAIPSNIKVIAPAIDADVLYLATADGRVMKLGLK